MKLTLRNQGKFFFAYLFWVNVKFWWRKILSIWNWREKRKSQELEKEKNKPYKIKALVSEIILTLSIIKSLLFEINQTLSEINQGFFMVNQGFVFVKAWFVLINQGLNPERCASFGSNHLHLLG